MHKTQKAITSTTKFVESFAFLTDTRYSVEDIYNLLLSIEELRDQKISTIMYTDGACEFIIGDTTYLLFPVSLKSLFTIT